MEAVLGHENYFHSIKNSRIVKKKKHLCSHVNCRNEEGPLLNKHKIKKQTLPIIVFLLFNLENFTFKFLSEQLGKMNQS